MSLTVHGYHVYMLPLILIQAEVKVGVGSPSLKSISTMRILRLLPLFQPLSMLVSSSHTEDSFRKNEPSLLFTAEDIHHKKKLFKECARGTLW